MCTFLFVCLICVQNSIRPDVTVSMTTCDDEILFKCHIKKLSKTFKYKKEIKKKKKTARNDEQ